MEGLRVSTEQPGVTNRKLYPIAIGALIALIVIVYIATRESTLTVTASQPPAVVTAPVVPPAPPPAPTAEPTPAPVASDPVAAKEEASRSLHNRHNLDQSHGRRHYRCCRRQPDVGNDASFWRSEFNRAGRRECRRDYDQGQQPRYRAAGRQRPGPLPDDSSGYSQKHYWLTDHPGASRHPPFQGGENRIPLLKEEGWREAPGWSVQYLLYLRVYGSTVQAG